MRLARARGVLAIHHQFGDPVTGATWTQDELRTDDLVVVRATHHDGQHDDGVERAVTRGGSSHAAVQFFLEGPHQLRHRTRDIEITGGTVSASHDLRACVARSMSHRSDVLVLAWRKESALGRALAHDDLLNLSAKGQAALVDLAHAMRANDRPVDALRNALAALAAAGVPLVPNVQFTPPTTGEIEVARAIEQTVFPLTARPMAVDLARALGIGERQALRRVNAFIEKYYASGSTWRGYVHAMRIGLSAFFMSHPHATTEHVSKLLGFASPTSFCHALQQAGLPSPTAMQRAAA